MPRYKASTRPFKWFNNPEWNIALFSFLLYFFWEIQQMPFFQLPLGHSCAEVVKNCSFATVGDVGISLLAFWAVAAISKSRQWFHQPQRWQVGIFILVGVVITIIFEALATEVFKLWTYADTMPTLPLLRTGLSPLLAWILIPPVVMWLVQRQLTSTENK